MSRKRTHISQREAVRLRRRVAELEQYQHMVKYMNGTQIHWQAGPTEMVTAILVARRLGMTVIATAVSDKNTITLIAIKS